MFKKDCFAWLPKLSLSSNLTVAFRFSLGLLKVTSIYFGENCFCFLQDLIITGIFQFIQLVIDLPSLQELYCNYQSFSGVISFEMRSFIFWSVYNSIFLLFLLLLLILIAFLVYLTSF